MIPKLLPCRDRLPEPTVKLMAFEAAPPGFVTTTGKVPGAARSDALKVIFN